ncbi:MAG: exodeoxyribonuclease V subunit gamma [Candidatus Cloacimonetes bacterium]|nr:exodeoxyribonuclease V subunit gamma [Candidatus Cloacimonadota bacterium]
MSSKLSENISTMSQDPFLAPKVIIPNKNLSKWLNLQLATQDGIAMNLNFVFLEMALWNQVSSVLNLKEKYELLGADTIQLIVQQELQQNNPDYQVFSDYIQENSLGSSKRFSQICDRLAFFLLEYEYHRMEMVYEWLDEKFSDDPLHKGIAKLYVNIRNRLKNTKHRSLFQLSEDILNGSVNSTIDNKETIHVFALSQISKFHIELIRKLQNFCNFCIYTINPCAEYWEDVESPSEKSWKKRLQKDMALTNQEIEDGELENNFENELVASLGKPGRENIKLLCDLTGYDFEDLYVFNYEIDKFDLLHQLQDGLLTLSQGDHSSIQDHSIQIFEAQSKMREFEIIYASIVKNLQDNKDLSLHDIAVLVPNVSDYQSIIINTFERQDNILSYNLADTSADQESLLAKGLSNFFQVIKEGLNRERLIKLLENSSIRDHFDINQQNLKEIFKYILDLGIFENDIHNITQGSLHQRLKQLRLSKIMKASNGYDEIQNNYAGTIPINQKSFTQDDTVSKFSFFVDHLFQYIEIFQFDTITIESLLEKLQDFVRNFFDFSNHQAEETVYKEVHKHLYRAKQLEIDLKDHLILNQETSFDYIESFLKGIASGRGNYLLGGITIASLQPMRPMPYKIVYVAGLEEGSFPGVEIKSSLDLRLIKRRIGDVSLPERNRYLFLELLHCVREKLYLSYVGKNLKKDQDLEPSSVIQEVISCLQSYIQDDFQVVKTKLSPYLPVSNHQFSDLSDSFFTSDQAISAFQNQQEAITKNLFVKDFSSQNIASVEDNREELTSYSLRHLAKFIKNPIETLADLKYGISKYQDSYLELHSNLYPDYSFDFFESFEVKNSFITDTVTSNQDLSHQANYHQYLSQTGKGPSSFIFQFLNQFSLNQLKGLSAELQKLSSHDFFHVSIGEDSIVNSKVKSHYFDSLEFTQFQTKLTGSLPLFTYDDHSVHIICPLYGSVGENSKIYPLLFVYALLLHTDCTFIKDQTICNIHFVTSTEVTHQIFAIDKFKPQQIFNNLLLEFFDPESVHLDLNLNRAVYGFLSSIKANHICNNEDCCPIEFTKNYQKYVNDLDKSNYNGLFVKDKGDQLLQRAFKRFKPFYTEVKKGK